MMKYRRALSWRNLWKLRLLSGVRDNAATTENAIPCDLAEIEVESA